MLSFSCYVTINYKAAASLFLQVWRPHRPLLVLRTAKKISARLCLLQISMKSSNILWLLGKLIPLHWYNSSSQTLIPAWIPCHAAVETIVSSFLQGPHMNLSLHSPDTVLCKIKHRRSNTPSSLPHLID